MIGAVKMFSVFIFLQHHKRVADESVLSYARAFSYYDAFYLYI